MYKHTCQICGMEFESPSARAKYCIYCRDKAQVMRNSAYKEKKQAGEAVAIGSEQVCSICGKPYKVTAGSQKYCKECQQKQYVSAEERDAIKAYAESLGMSVNKLLLTALEEYKEKHNGEKQ